MRFLAYYRDRELALEAAGWVSGLAEALRLQTKETGPLEALDCTGGDLPVDATDRHPS